MSNDEWSWTSASRDLQPFEEISETLEDAALGGKDGKHDGNLRAIKISLLSPRTSASLLLSAALSWSDFLF